MAISSGGRSVWRPEGGAFGTATVRQGSGAAEGTRGIGAVLVFCALTFNVALAFVNAHVVPLTPAAVIGAEILITGAAHLTALANYRDEMRPWYGLIVLLGLLAVFRAFGTGAPDLKSFRDGLIIPTFILLGMTVPVGALLRVTLLVHGLTFALLALEALNTDAFSWLLEIKSYYINTRGLSSESFWNTESNLFVSATRPDERYFFPALDLHRASSIFLEPVSLGNYCVVVTCILCATWHRLTVRQRAFLIAANAALIVGCDGRLAFLSSLLVVVAASLARRLPPFVEGLYIPTALTFGFLAVTLGGWRVGSDDIPGRVALTVDLLGRFGAVDFLGLSSEFLSLAVDSGLVYLIATQTIIGVFAILAFIVFLSGRSRIEQVKYSHGVFIFMASNFLVSFSFLSLKTAALLWTVYGALQVPLPAPSRPASPGLAA